MGMFRFWKVVDPAKLFPPRKREKKMLDREFDFDPRNIPKIGPEKAIFSICVFLEFCEVPPEKNFFRPKIGDLGAKNAFFGPNFSIFAFLAKI